MSMLQRVTTLTSHVDLSGRSALVVGATAGIGASIARQLAKMGATTIIIGRDATKLERSRAELEAIAPGRIYAELADLADLAAVRRAAAAVSSAHPRLDIVIANASVQFAGKRRNFTQDGFEATFGVNHLGNAALLMALERPIRAACGRVVIVASEAHRRAKGLPLDDLMGEHGFDGVIAYNRSKLANILFARQLARRWPDVSVYAAHPGAVLTDMMFRMVAEIRLARLIFPLIRWQLLTPDESAQGIVRIAVDPALTEASGTYFEVGHPAQSSRLADDAGVGQQLFDATTAYLNQ